MSDGGTQMIDGEAAVGAGEAAGFGQWSRAVKAAVLFALDPVGLGGVVLRARSGPQRDAWLALVERLLAGRPMRKMPIGVTDDRLLGGLDLAQTLSSRRPVFEQGLLAQVDGGVLVITAAERQGVSAVAQVAMAMDRGEVLSERDGQRRRAPSRFGFIALDEGVDADEAVDGRLPERAAFIVALDEVRLKTLSDELPSFDDLDDVRALLPSVVIPDEALQAIVEAAAALGVMSIRHVMLACRCACASAALDGRTTVDLSDLAFIAEVVLAPRATAMPSPPQPPPEDAQEPETAEPPPDAVPDEQAMPTPDELQEIILAAARALLPEGLLSQLERERRRNGARGPQGRVGDCKATPSGRGRPAGVRAGRLRRGVRLNVLETLRAAAPWQSLRRGRSVRQGQGAARDPLAIRPQDFRISYRVQPQETTTIFVVDASGSSALYRLSEVKGAIELLLGDCYVRRDQVAMIAFRGLGADVVLEPTRSLVRAKKQLAAMPGGGGTPVAAGLDRARELAQQALKRGRQPTLVVLTDGAANISRAGKGGRAQAEEDALASARRLASEGFSALVIDSSPKRRPQAEALARAMKATYLALPHANSKVVSDAVRRAMQ